MKQINKELTAQIEELKQQLQMANKDKQATIQQLKLEHQLEEELTKPNDQLTKSPYKDITLLRDQLQQQQSESELLKNMVKAAQRTIGTKESELTRLRGRVKKLETENADLLQRYSTLQDICQTAVDNSIHTTQRKVYQHKQSKSLQRVLSTGSSCNETPMKTELHLQLKPIKFKIN